MKQLFTLLTLTISFFMTSQTVLLEDFSSSPSIEGFEGLGSATIVADPVTSGNGDGLQLVTSASGQLWQGANIMLAAGSYANISTFKTLTMDVYSTTEIHLYAEIHDTSFGNAMQGNTQTHSGSGWETLTFTYSAANGTFTKIALFPNRNAAGDDFNNPVVQATIVIDNIKSGEAAPTNQNGLQDGDETDVDCGGSSGNSCGLEPITSAPTSPDRNANDVASIISDTYSNHQFDEYQPTWGIGTLSDFFIGDDKMWKVSGFEKFAVADYSVPQFDISTMEKFHLDFFTEGSVSTGDVIKLQLVSAAGAAAGNDVIVDVATVTGGGTWQSIEFDLTTTKGTKDWSQIIQVILILSTNNQEDYYFDNMYFSKGTPLSVSDLSDSSVSVYPNPVQNTLNVSAAVTVDAVSIFDLTGRQVLRATPNAAAFTLDVADLNKGMYLVSLKSGDKEMTTKLVK